MYAVITIYDLTLKETKKGHQFQQLEMAKAALTGIRTYLYHIEEDMKLLTFLPNQQFLDKNTIQSRIDNLYNHYEDEAIKTIFFADMNANLVYSKGEPLPAWSLNYLKKNANWTIEPESIFNCRYSEVRPNYNNKNNTGLSFLLLTPYTDKVKTNNSTHTAIRTLGTFGYVLSFDSLINNFITPLKLSKNDFAWIIDANGRLIYHPKHKEMLLRSIKEATTECSSCHSSFDMQHKMLTNGASSDEYAIGSEPPKIMSYAPIQLHNEKWILVISTFLPEVTANLRAKFKIFFILGIIILIAIISFGVLLYYVNAKRIRAEEASRQIERNQELQQQLNQASKLASIGELVDTVAHEINTPTGIISAYLDAMLLEKKKNVSFSGEINIIKQQIKRISKYTHSLLGYSKRMPFHPTPTNIKELIDDTVFLLGHRLRAQKITIVRNYPEKLKPLLLDRGQMEQVFVNLINNAIDAMEGPGRIEICIKTIQADSIINEDSKNKGVHIEFSDTGIGIEEHNLKKIFEPFFSTKLPKEGTGLGLYISKAIIQRHRGKIEVTSTAGKGTQFEIFLPKQ